MNSQDELAEYQELFLLYEKTHEIDYLEAAIAVAETMEQSDDNTVGTDLRKMVNLKVELSQAAAEPDIVPRGVPQDDTEHAAEKSAQIFSRYQRTKGLKDLNDAIELAKISTLTPPKHPARPLRLSRVCMMLAERFERLRNGDDYNHILRIITAVQDLTEDTANGSGDTTIQSSVSRIMASVISRIDGWIFNGIIRSLDDQVDASRVLIDPRADNQQVGGMQHWITKRPNMPYVRGETDTSGAKGSNAGMMYHILFPREPEDIDEAATHESEMLAATPQEDPRRMHWYCVLGQQFLRRYVEREVPEDLELAIRFGEQAVAAIPPGNIGRVQTLLCWANICSVVHMATGDLSQLDIVIQVVEETISASSVPGAPAKWFSLTLLASVYRRRHATANDVDDLDDAIELLEEAMTLTKDTNPVELAAERESLLSVIYLSAINSTSDLDRAIKLHEDALDIAKAAVPPDETYELRDSGLRLVDLLFRRFHKTHNKDDLARGIKYGENILRAARYLKMDSELTGRRFLHPELMREVARFVGVMLVDRYIHLDGDPTDLDKAEKVLHKAIEGATGTPASHLQWRISQLHLAKFRQTSNPQELEKAHRWIRKALETLPSSDDEYRYVFAEELAMIVDAQMQYENTHTGNYRAVISKWQQLLMLYLQQWESENLMPNPRILGARNAANIYLQIGMVEEAYSLLEKAVAELPRLCQRSGRRDDQQYMLSCAEVYELAAIGASVAIRAGRGAYQALKMLEFGRVLISGFSIDCRSDLSDLRASHPEYADIVEKLRTEMDYPHVEERRQRGRKLATAEFEKILHRIRQLPGHEEFLLPPPPESLMKIAADGTIVMINCNAHGSDAITVTSSSIQSLPLPRLLYKDVEQHMAGMSASLKGTARNYNSRNKSMGKHLLWLWEAVVAPVLDHLQLDESNPTRIWWIGVGKLSMAPFHAAGDHSPGSTNNTLGRAISSYVPSIKALSYTRQKQLNLFPEPDWHPSFPDHGEGQPVATEKPRLLMVTMPTTAGSSPLAGAKQEAKDIAGALSSGSVSVTELERPSAAQVLEQLRTHHILHFACHGISDLANPSDSRLLLQSPDPTSSEPDTLSVRAVSSANTDVAQIAYLSACSTAENRSVLLADEAIHIANAFQLAGFSHVLATLWESDDRLCRRVATEFYKNLFNGSAGVEGHLKVARAYHLAVKTVRDKKPKDFLGWAPFIHTGA